jgi:hypothetical protein
MSQLITGYIKIPLQTGYEATEIGNSGDGRQYYTFVI